MKLNLENLTIPNSAIFTNNVSNFSNAERKKLHDKDLEDSLKRESQEDG